MIHPSAIVDPKSKIAANVSIGPGAVIDADVSVGPDCRIGPHVHLTGHTIIGANNVFHSGCVIGDAPQDLKYKDEPTRLSIGEDNVFREHVTVHRSNQREEDTVIGSNNFFMAHSHVGHNCHVGNSVILANGALLGGHVVVGDRVFISGHCMVHQFVRLGTLVLMQGGSGVSKDVPPYSIVRGINSICGLNIIGLRRAGFSPEQRMELKRIYHALFRSRHRFGAAFAAAQAEFTSEIARGMLDFIAQSKRGVCMETREKNGDADTAEQPETGV